jgi:SHS2 domain-containing protein
MAEPTASFKEIEHTADLGVEITAATFPALVATSGEALFALIADPRNIDPTQEISVSARGDDPEELLLVWLCELLARFNIEGFVGKKCSIDQITADRLDGKIRGEKLDLNRHRFRTEIKGVTYHQFRVWQEVGCGMRGSSSMCDSC